MSTQAKPKILLVDDEQRVIESLAQLLRRDFDVRTASVPQEALKSLDEIHGLAVVVSDFRMPGMDGATLLHQFMVRRPDVSRILLTGESGREGAIRAINEGQILRFLTKPCPIEELKAALDAGVIQHRLVRAERSVLQETLIGCIKALMEVLSIANPVAFGRAERIRKAAIQCAERLNCTDFWQLEAAAMLSQLGYITVPETALEKMYAGQPLTPSRCCNRQAVDGKIRSGVVVPSTIRSSSDALTPAASSARCAARNARSPVVSPSAAIWRWRMPVRVRIHSSLVSTIFSRSALVTTRSGSALPVAMMRE